MYKNAEHAAYPSNHDDNCAPEYGLTKREYFAAMAMQGIVAQNGSMFIESNATEAVKQADALLKQLEKTK